ncbi:cell division protein ZapA [uncultured Sulfitobacter sp.]|uniref:cell division protein ZapA n=1 Tax=uncultured Sulfitobacter sp. TaxID=191468 RepID=UPI002636E409|nr:cell division protein ZapA [uncultured Sulfitobacter sp.]
MPEVRITIGGRQFEVACQDGEEGYLHSAAKMLDDEAQVLSDQVGRMPEARMLLMAGLLLADKAASVEDRINEVRSQLAEREAELAGLRNAGPEAERVEVPVVPQEVKDTLAELAARAEALAAQVEENADGDAG